MVRNLVKLGVLVLIAGAVQSEADRRIVVPFLSPFAAILLVLVVSHAVALLRRTPQLRATPAGVWLGGRDIIPWRDVSQYYEVEAQRSGFSLRPRAAITIRVRRRGPLLRVLPRRWHMTTVEIWVYVSVHPPEELIAQLEKLRLAGVDHAACVRTDASKLPNARVVAS